MFKLAYVSVALLLLGGLFALTGCASDVPPAPAHVICPSIVPYSKKQQTDLSSELKSHPDLTAVHFFLSDYAGLRDQVRACEKTK